MKQLERLDVENPKLEQLLADCVLTHDRSLHISCEMDVLKLWWGQKNPLFLKRCLKFLSHFPLIDMTPRIR